MNMRRVIVIGCPGSGKSTFSKVLHTVTDIPLYHLDMMYWNADKTTVEKSIFLERLDEVLKKDSWIIDGNYASTMERRMSVCDTVIFLDYPTEICLAGLRERRGKPRDDMPWTETEEDTAFTEYVSNFREHSRPAVLELLEKYRNKSIMHFTGREQTDSFLKGDVR